MYLKELSINGFKSFAKKGELEFSAPITAIVGPNGSGKSNVAESFRFVLGEQSVKSMRGKKGEDLIWGGSEKITRGNRASVEITFDNTGRNFALDFDEVKIERVVHRDGQNEYKINGSQVRLKDIHELLAGANIGSTGHHIISQGEADRVLSAAPKDRREMIEDALGLKVYQLKKAETDRKLAKTEENIAQVESLRREAAPHLKYLKKQVERAERSIEVQRQLKESYGEYLKREDSYVAYHYDRLTEAKHDPERELHKVQKEVEEAKEKLQEPEIATEDQELTQAENKKREAVTHLQAVQSELNQLVGQINFLEKRIAQAEVKTDNSNVLIHHAQVEKLIADVTSGIEKSINQGGESNLKRALSDIVHQLRSFLKKTQGETVDTTQADKEALDDLKNKIASAEKLVTKAREEEIEAEERLTKLRSAKVDDLEHKRDAEKVMFEAIQKQRELEVELKQIDTELSVLQRDRDEFKRELQEAVTLIGRNASDYFSLELKDSSGQVITKEVMAGEAREEQYKRRRDLEKLKIRLEELGVGATDDLMKEYDDTKARDEFLAKELEDLSASVKNLQELMLELQSKLEEQFATGVDKIDTEFNKFFNIMFGGGSAKLQKVTIKSRQSEDFDEEPETSEGVELHVSLPNKRVKGLDMLSGGERALTSIALIFAMSQVNPPPFIILDETDAALDEAIGRAHV